MENYRQKVERYIGRKLLRTEVVHHKDGNDYNNNITNLEILSPSEHKNKKHLSKKYWNNVNKDKLPPDFIKIILYQDFNKCINIFFTPRMKNIIFKKLHSERLSKTEKEYYSRIIKKRLYALTNEILQKIARLLISK